MKVVSYERYGGPEVVSVVDVRDPAPSDHEVLVRVRASTVESGDARLRALRVPRGFTLPLRLFLGIRRPRRRVLGVTLAGEVVAVGAKVTKLAVGDEIFALVGVSLACHAELRVLHEDAAFARKPPSLGWAEAAALPFGGHTVLDFFRRGAVRSGERVLVIGASGSVGVAAVQIAKHLGCDVTGVCSGKNAALVRSLGADRVIDYTREDFTAGSETWDVIVDTVGNHPFSRVGSALRDGGRLLAVVATLPEMLAAPWVAMTTSKRVIAGTGPERAEDLRTLAELATSRKLRPVVSASFPFSRAAEAHAIVDSGRKVGTVALVPDALWEADASRAGAAPIAG